MAGPKDNGDKYVTAKECNTMQKTNSKIMLYWVVFLVGAIITMYITVSNVRADITSEIAREIRRIDNATIRTKDKLNDKIEKVEAETIKENARLNTEIEMLKKDIQYIRKVAEKIDKKLN